jgi:cytochrome bd-type quinol oxidase subunit 2
VADSPLKIPYLFAYNLVFIIPLVVILVVFSSRQAILHFRRMHAENASKTALILGIVMTTVGTALLTAIALGVH